MIAKPVILLADDDTNDVVLFRSALAASGTAARLVVVPDGEYAISYLSGRSPYTEREKYPLPDLLITDLKMHPVSGFELLEWVRRSPDFVNLRVVVLTGSRVRADRDRAVQLNVASFHTKGTMQDLRGFIARLQDFLPTKTGKSRTHLAAWSQPSGTKHSRQSSRLLP